MNTDMDPKAEKMLAKTTEDLAKKLQDRLAEKWPEYRETDSSAKRKEILVTHHRRMALRWGKVWLPRDADREVRAMEALLDDWLERRGDGDDASADADALHRSTLQGLVNLGNALARTLRAAQGGNRDARIEAIDRVARAVTEGRKTVEILEEAERYQPVVRVEEMDPNDVRD